MALRQLEPRRLRLHRLPRRIRVSSSSAQWDTAGTVHCGYSEWLMQVGVAGQGPAVPGLLVGDLLQPRLCRLPPRQPRPQLLGQHRGAHTGQRSVLTTVLTIN